MKADNTPRIGDIWLDTMGEHSLILRLHKDGQYGPCAHILCLETGREFTQCELRDFGEDKFFILRVA